MQSYRHQAVQQSPASLVRLIIHFNYLTLHCRIHCKCRGCIYIIIIYTARLGQVTALAWSLLYTHSWSWAWRASLILSCVLYCTLTLSLGMAYTGPVVRSTGTVSSTATSRQIHSLIPDYGPGLLNFISLSKISWDGAAFACREGGGHSRDHVTGACMGSPPPEQLTHSRTHTQFPNHCFYKRKLKTLFLFRRNL